MRNNQHLLLFQVRFAIPAIALVLKTTLFYPLVLCLTCLIIFRCSEFATVDIKMHHKIIVKRHNPKYFSTGGVAPGTPLIVE